MCLATDVAGQLRLALAHLLSAVDASLFYVGAQGLEKLHRGHATGRTNLLLATALAEQELAQAEVERCRKL